MYFTLKIYIFIVGVHVTEQTDVPRQKFQGYNCIPNDNLNIATLQVLQQTNVNKVMITMGKK